MAGYAPTPHPAASSQSQGAGPQVSKMVGLFWPQGDPGKLHQAAQAWRDMGSALDAAEGTCHGAANLVKSSSEGAAIDAFSAYWSKWDGNDGYFELSAQACREMAGALDRYAYAIDQARQRVEEIAITAGTVLVVGVALTVLTVGISDAAAAATEAALVAAAAAVGVELSTEVAAIAATVLVGAAIGTAASTVVDTAVQIEHIKLFQDQNSFNWEELGHSAELGAITGGAGAGIGLGARAVAPVLEDGVPGFSRMAIRFGRLPGWTQAGVRGTIVGGGMAAAGDELTTGQINPLDVALGATSGALGDVAAGRSHTTEDASPTPKEPTPKLEDFGVAAPALADAVHVGPFADPLIRTEVPEFHPSEAEQGLASSEIQSRKMSNPQITFLDGSQGVWKVDPDWDPAYTEGRAISEVAASRLDEMLGFHLVPTTTFRDIGDQTGSLQQWVSDATEQPSIHAYDPVDRERMAVLDYISANKDRNLGNWKTASDGRPIAIDHELTFGRHQSSEPYIASDFVEAFRREPLSEGVLERVRAVDPTDLWTMLRSTGVSEQAADGAVARLREIQQLGKITGAAWQHKIFPSGWA